MSLQNPQYIHAGEIITTMGNILSFIKHSLEYEKLLIIVDCISSSTLTTLEKKKKKLATFGGEKLQSFRVDVDSSNSHWMALTFETFGLGGYNETFPNRWLFRSTFNAFIIPRATRGSIFNEKLKIFEWTLK